MLHRGRLQGRSGFFGETASTTDSFPSHLSEMINLSPSITCTRLQQKLRKVLKDKTARPIARVSIQGECHASCWSLFSYPYSTRPEPYAVQSGPGQPRPQGPDRGFCRAYVRLPGGVPRWNRVLRAEIHSPGGSDACGKVHLASRRGGTFGWRSFHAYHGGELRGGASTGHGASQRRRS